MANVFDQFDQPAASGNVFDQFDAPAAQPGPTSWSDVGSQAIANAPGSAWKFAKDMVQPIIHPIDTIENIGKVGAGLGHQLGSTFGGPDPEADQAWDQFKSFYKDRYGSVEGFKKALATDPVGVLGDASMLLSGGESALARLPGVAGKVGEIAGAPGRAVSAVGRVAGNRAADVLGLSTGVGTEPIKAAFQAGVEGGGAGRALRQEMRGDATLSDIVGEARGALDQMRQERGAAYRTSMADIGMDQKVLNFDKIDDAMREAGKVQTYKGQDISPTTQAVRYKVADIIDEWRALDPYEFHTAEGLDALKRKIGDVRDATAPHTPERVVADRLYNGVRSTIVKQAPDYAHVMEAYSEASSLIKEIEQTLSLKPNANIDTSLRKLQSVLRNNVNTNYGRRAELVKYLAANGADNIIEKIAGQTLKEWMPRGLQRAVAANAGALGLGALGVGAPHVAASAAAAIPAMSPRLVGEAAHAVGQGTRYLSKLRKPAKLAPPLRLLNQASEPKETP